MASNEEVIHNDSLLAPPEDLLPVLSAPIEEPSSSTGQESSTTETISASARG